MRVHLVGEVKVFSQLENVLGRNEWFSAQIYATHYLANLGCPGRASECLV